MGLDQAKAILQDPLKTASGSAIAAIGAAVGAALASGAWRLALVALGVLAALLFALVLVSAATWHEGEIEEAGYERARDEDAEGRKLAMYERDHRRFISDVFERSSDLGTQQARMSALLEMLRKHISSGRTSPVELLVVADDDDFDAPELLARAGRFDQAMLDSARELGNWIASLGHRAHHARMRVVGRNYRLIGVADEPLGAHDEVEIQRAATHMQALLIAHGLNAALGAADVSEEAGQ